LKDLAVLLDTNLLILFVVGMTSREYIDKHKKLTAFNTEDYDELVKIVGRAKEVFVTPNTLTETSNLAAYIGEPARGEVFRALQSLIVNSKEIHVPSSTAAERAEFIRLGLTDAALIEASSKDTVMLTTDLDLYLAVISSGSEAINFNHLPHRNM